MTAKNISLDRYKQRFFGDFLGKVRISRSFLPKLTR